MSLFEQLQEILEIKKRKIIEEEKYSKECKKKLLEKIGDKKEFYILEIYSNTESISERYLSFINEPQYYERIDFDIF